jgi:hypothetical protein
MRVNEVIIKTMPGSSVTAVIRMRICSVSEYCCPPPGEVVTVTAGMPAAEANIGTNIIAHVASAMIAPMR